MVSLRATRGPASETAIDEIVAEAEKMGADAVIGVDVDYESIQIGQGGSVLMVSALGYSRQVVALPDNSRIEYVPTLTRGNMLVGKECEPREGEEHVISRYW